MLVACEPQATPFPASIPTATIALPAVSITPIRYAVAANTQGLIPHLELIQNAAQVEQLSEPDNPDDLGKRYDIVVAYGDMEEGITSPVKPHIALVLNSDIPPLNNPTLLSVLRRAINPQAIVTALNIPGVVPEIVEAGEPNKLRVELANAGWPDGFSLKMAYAYTPGFAELTEELHAAGIEVDALAMTQEDIGKAFEEKRIQMALIAWVTAEERQVWMVSFGEGNVMDLYSVPISYRAIPELKVTFTADGWPVVGGGAR